MSLTIHNNGIGKPAPYIRFHISLRCCYFPTILISWILVSIPGPGKAQEVPLPSFPALDRAAQFFAQGRLDEATQAFEEILQVSSRSAFLRGSAWFGLAEVAAARQDYAAAVAAWNRLAEDESLLPFHRESARRRISETERLSRGLTARDPQAYREKLPLLPQPFREFYVAPIGNDETDGSPQSPFRTLERARMAVRALKQSHGGQLPPGGVKIILRTGLYSWRATLKLNAEDSGAPEAPVVYQGPTNRMAVLCGGIEITGWAPIADPKVWQRLDASVRGRVLQADLKRTGVEDWGDPTALRHRPELFVDGHPQILARWPNEGFVRTGEILGTNTFKVWDRLEGCRDGKFRFLEDRPTRWLDEPDVRLYGYWFWDWFEEYQKVDFIDAENKVIAMAQPFSGYGYRQDQRYFALNVFRELDSEGEWYLDRLHQKVYWLPPLGLDLAKARTVLSVFEQPFIAMNDVEHVVIRNLTLQEGRGDGIHLQDGAHGLIANCTIQRLGGDAIVINGGRQHGIYSCDLHTLGCGGTRVAGGDRQKLTPGRHFVENCTVSNISRLKRTYTPAVHLDGCGNRIAHNLFENMPSSAMRIEGNLFIYCPAGLTFSRWGRSRWLESVERFLPQAQKPVNLSRYPALAHLKKNPDVNQIGRNLIARCEAVFLRDGGIQNTTLNALADGILAEQIASGAPSPVAAELMQSILFEPIPTEEIGPYGGGHRGTSCLE